MQSVTLNENRDFRRAYAKGKSRVHRLLVTYVLRNRLGVNRVSLPPKKSAKPADATAPDELSAKPIVFWSRSFVRGMTSYLSPAAPPAR